MAGIAPTPTPTTFQDQYLLKAADLNGMATHLGFLYQQTMAGFRNYKPFAGAYITANHALASGVNGFVNFDAETVDTDNMWTNTAPAQFTVNTAGYYRLLFQCHWDATGNGQRVCRILANGTDPNANAIATDNRTPVTVFEGTTTFCQCVAHLAAGTILHPYVTQNSGGTVNLVNGFSGTQFSVEWVAPY